MKYEECLGSVQNSGFYCVVRASYYTPYQAVNSKLEIVKGLFQSWLTTDSEIPKLNVRRASNSTQESLFRARLFTPVLIDNQQLFSIIDERIETIFVRDELFKRKLTLRVSLEYLRLDSNIIL